MKEKPHMAKKSEPIKTADQPLKAQTVTEDKVGANVRKPGAEPADAATAEPTKADRKAAAEITPDPAPVFDATVPVPHVPHKSDVPIWVPRSAGQYGIVSAGEQTLYEIAPVDESDAAPLGRLGLVKVHPDHVERFLRNVEGSVLAKPGTMTAEQEAAEAARPFGRRAGPPLTAEEVQGATEQATLAGAAAGDTPAAQPSSKAAPKAKK
jgi:hypothetical protein